MDSDANPFTRDNCQLTDLERSAFVEIVLNLVRPDSTATVSQSLMGTHGPRSTAFMDAMQRKMRAAWRTKVA